MRTTKSYLKLGINQKGRDLIVGDVHGQAPLLDRLLQNAAYDPRRDRLLALGDLVDRGPDCVDLIKRTTQRGVYSVMGNHEAMMISASANYEASRAWNRNQNGWTRDLDPQIMLEVKAIAERFPLAIELPLRDGRIIGLIHAEVQVGESWTSLRSAQYGHRDASDDMGFTVAASALWGRSRILADARMRTNPQRESLSADVQIDSWEAALPIPGIDLVISGHSVVLPAIPRGRGNVLWIETGAYEPKGRLTVVDPLARCYWQAGHGPDELYGPTPLPAIDRVPESWRPTPELEEQADHEREEERKRLALLLGWSS